MDRQTDRQKQSFNPTSAYARGVKIVQAKICPMYVYSFSHKKLHTFDYKRQYYSVAIWPASYIEQVPLYIYSLVFKLYLAGKLHVLRW